MGKESKAKVAETSDQLAKVFGGLGFASDCAKTLVKANGELSSKLESFYAATQTANAEIEKLRSGRGTAKAKLGEALLSLETSLIAMDGALGGFEKFLDEKKKKKVKNASIDSSRKTLGEWQKNLGEIRKEAKAFYQLL